MTTSRWMNALMTGAVTVVVTLCANTLGAQEASTTLTPEALAEIAQVEMIEAMSVRKDDDFLRRSGWLGAPPGTSAEAKRCGPKG